MFQFHSNNLSSPPAWQVDAPTESQPRQDWRGEISGGTPMTGKAVIPYTDLRHANNTTPLPRAEQADLQMSNGLPMDVVATPTSLEEVYQGSMKAILKKNTGNCIRATFLVGTENLVTWDGVLFDVGNDYMTIYQDDVDRYVIGDIYSLKFVEFFNRLGETCAGNLKQSSPQVW